MHPHLQSDVEREEGREEEHNDGRDRVEDDTGGPQEEDRGLNMDEVRVSQQGDPDGDHDEPLGDQHGLVGNIDIIRKILLHPSVLPTHAWFVVIQDLCFSGDLMAKHLSIYKLMLIKMIN